MEEMEVRIQFKQQVPTQRRDSAIKQNLGHTVCILTKKRHPGLGSPAIHILLKTLWRNKIIQKYPYEGGLFLALEPYWVMLNA